MVTADELMALASLAGQTVVTAAVTDAWETARRKIARLFGGDDSERTRRAERRLDQTREQLTAARGADVERVRADLAATWKMRLADLLEEDPGAEAELRATVEEIRALLPTGPVSTVDHAVVAGGNVNIGATSRGVAAGVIHGNVAPPGPSMPGPASGQPGSGSLVVSGLDQHLQVMVA